MSKNKYSKIKLINNCVNNPALYISNETPKKDFLVITLCSRNKSDVEGIISDVRLINPKNPNVIFYPIDVADLTDYPETQSKILSIKPMYSFNTADKYPLKPICFVFDVTNAIPETKKLHFLYVTNTRKQNHRITFNVNLAKMVFNPYR